MWRHALSVTLLAIAGLAPLGARGDNFSLKSVNVDLPIGDRMFPDGPGSDAVNNNCLACHSADMVINQPALSKAQWEAEVEKMRKAYKAPIDTKDISTIVGYLVSIKGAK